jgi:polyhydroxybutyrate depolymerase
MDFVYQMKKISKIIVIFFLISLILPMVIADIDDLNNFQLSSSNDSFKLIFYENSIRSYRVHIPSSYDDITEVPLVIGLHGYPSCSKVLLLYSGLTRKSDEEGFIAVYPNGKSGNINEILFSLRAWRSWGRAWNCWDQYSHDDVGFIKHLIKKIIDEYSIDSSKIFITGISNGGMLAYRIGAELSDMITAIAPISSTIGGKWSSEEPEYIIPEPKNPLPVIVFHGEEDNIIPYDGGGLNNYKSVNESVDFWVTYNKCNSTPLIETINNENITVHTYSDGDEATEVMLYSYKDKGHEWFGEWNKDTISATDIMWDFFNTHSD